VKPTFLRCAAALAAGAALLAALPAPAADEKPAVKPAPALAAIQALLRELQQAGDSKLPATVRMERMAARRPSSDTAERLRTVFGTDTLYTLARQPSTPQRIDWRLTVPPLHHAPAGATAFDWSEGRIDFQYNPAGTTAVMHGSWDMLAAQDARMRFAARGMTLDSRERRGADRLWYGTARMAAAGVSVLAAQDNVAIELLAPSLAVAVVDRGKTGDIGYDLRLGRIEAAGERVEDVRLALRVVKLDKAALAALSDAGARGGTGSDTGTPQQQAALLKPILRELGATMIARGTALDIDEISARYHGIKAVIKGRVALQGATQADLADPKALFGKIGARFDVRIPIAMVRAIATTVAARQAAQQGKTSDPQSVAQLGQSMTDVVVGKLLGGGFARLDNDVLLSTVEWRGGVLLANGKPVPLPTPAAPAAAQPPVALRARGTDVLQARRIDGSCTLPDYPDDVVRQDLALEARFAFVVTAEGKVQAAGVASASAFPDYDRAVAAALATCTYAPALRDGKPFDLATSWRLVRVPGTQRP
jgi:hypothetical protein